MGVAQPADTAAAGLNLHVSATLRAQRRLHFVSLLASDLIATNLAFFVAYHLRYVYELGGDVPGESFVAYAAYAPVQALFVALCLLACQVRGGYSVPRGSSIVAEAGTLFASSAVATMALFAITSLVRYPASSRLTFIYAWIFAFLLGIVGRALVRAARTYLHRSGYGAERVIVVGNTSLSRMVMQMLAQQRHLGYQVLGFVDQAVRTDFGRFRALGTVEQLPQILERTQATRVIVALPAAQHQQVLSVLDHCRNDGVEFSLVPDLFELRLSHLAVEDVAGIPLFRLSEPSITGFNRVVKRALDVVGSVIAVVVLAPLMLLVAVAIRVDSPGPTFFRQVRLGKGGAAFICYKFRSMRERAEDEVADLQILNEAEGPLFKMRRDPRVTRVGRWIRRLSIDELPQLWNVLRGEMSLVGPRPPIPAEVEQYEEWHRRRLEVVPGITGLWQVSGRSHLSFDEMVMLDIYYIENWSLGLDVQILLRTLPAVMAADGAF